MSKGGFTGSSFPPEHSYKGTTEDSCGGLDVPLTRLTATLVEPNVPRNTSPLR